MAAVMNKQISKLISSDDAKEFGKALEVIGKFMGDTILMKLNEGEAKFVIPLVMFTLIHLEDKTFMMNARIEVPL